MLRWLLAMSVFSVACARTGRPCGGKVLLLWPDQSGSYAPRVVEAPELNRASVLVGPSARVHYQARVGARGYDGAPAAPHVTRGGDVCIPTDAPSAVAISAYLQFERLHQFDRELGIADQVTWPRQVGVETRLTDGAAESVNNAHYVGEKDVVLLVPTTLPHVPAAMNHGIVAHEHAHAHVQSQVLERLSVTPPTVSSEASAWLNPGGFFATPGRVLRVANDFILRGWNEGLADFYAAVYLGRAEFLRDTFPNEELVRSRALDGPALYLSNDHVPTLVRRMETATGQGRDQARDDLSRNAYGQGTALARTLWRVVNDGEPSGNPRAMLAAMMNNLKHLPARINPHLNTQPLDYGWLLHTLLEDAPLTPGACAHLRTVLRPGDRSFERISRCASF